MRKYYIIPILMWAFSLQTNAQIQFDPTIPTDFNATEVVMPASPLELQILFIGGEDMVQALDDNGDPSGAFPAKENHDFIGIKQDLANPGEWWVVVNHETIIADENLGDGGGMTMFKVQRDANTDTLQIIDHTLADGRSGEFFNVDFRATGETAVNCGGIVSLADGRIWTSEELFHTSNLTISLFGVGITDISDFTIQTDITGDFNGTTVEKYENFNWMVEIDPENAVAIRKQYNWGRQPFEGGVVMPDNQTVYLTPDATPAFFSKFIADTPGDFTEGTLYVYRHDVPGANGPWVEINSQNFQTMLNYFDMAIGAGATMFNRLEWSAAHDGKIYMTETGRSNPGSNWSDEAASGAQYAPHHVQRAQDQGVTNPGDGAYWDYYGRVLQYDPATGEITSYIEGGPYFASSPAMADYPNNHLSSPDGLNFITVGAKTYMIICEDLTGTSRGRVPAGVSDEICELYLLDMDIQNPTTEDLFRISMMPQGAEVTGAIASPDGKSILVNCQHPSTSNAYPFNHSVTFAINGFDQVASAIGDPIFEEQGFGLYPNPASREIRFKEATDAALYDASGKRILVIRNQNWMNVSHLPAGTYFIRNKDNQTAKLIIE